MKEALYSGLRYIEDVVKGESVTKHLRRLRKMMQADPEYIREYQFKAMKKLIAYAYENTAFYKQRFDEQGVHPEDIRSIDDFSQLKPVTREDIRVHGLELIAKGFSKDRLISGFSSGSTGEPIEYFHDKQAYSAGRAAVLAGWELAGKKIGDRTITLWGNRDTIEQNWSKPGSRLKAKLYREKRFPVDRFIEESYIRKILNMLIEQNGGFIFGYSNPIYLLACYAKEKGVEIQKKFDGILTTAEKIFPDQREVVEEVFGPVFDSYGSREILGKGYQCRERKGYHIVEPNLIFEAEKFKDDYKEVVVTDLWNYAWPLIRYNIGDLIAGEFGRCSCECTWMTFDTIIGRANDILKLPDGGYVLPLFWVIDDIIKHASKAKQRQFVKVSDNKIVFRVQLFEGQDSSFVEDLRAAMARRFEGIIETDVEIVESFPLGPSGKHKSLVDETQ